MEWLVNAFWAKIGWMLGEVAIAAAVITGIVVIVTIASIPRFIRQGRCTHARFHETSACEAICSDCGKNLGFIGAWKNRIKAAHGEG